MSGQPATKFLPLVTRQCTAYKETLSLSCRSWSSSSAPSSARTAFLQSRGVLEADGPQVLAFLQGLVSNDVRPLEGAGPQQPPVYATILTPKGKFLHDVFIHPHPSVRGAVLLDVDRSGVPAALQLLNRYKLRRPISLRDASSDFRVATCWGAASPPQGPWWRPDPRLPELGFRGIVPAMEEEAALRGSGSAGSPADEEDFKALRYRLGVAEGESEIPTGQAAPLDYNVDVLNGVSYTKGCYVGQERNSFTHYRGVIRRRLMPVRLELSTGGGAGPGPASTAAAAPLPGPGVEVVDVASGRAVGQIRGASAGCASASRSQGTDRWGIAYLKLDSALAAAEGRAELRIAALAPQEGSAKGSGSGEVALAAAGDGTGQTGGPVEKQEARVLGVGTAQTTWRVVPVRPRWWLPEWGHEEEGSGA